MRTFEGAALRCVLLAGLLSAGLCALNGCTSSSPGSASSSDAQATSTGTPSDRDPAIVRQTRSVGSFDKVDSGGFFDLTIDAAAPATSVVLAGPAGILSKIKTEVRNGTLVITEESGTVEVSTSTPHVTIGVPTLAGVSVSGASSVAVTKVHANAFALNVSGAANVKLAGTAGALATTLSGAASVDAVALKARSVTISISGTGKAKVWASDSLTASVAGVGSIEYFGKPANVKQSIAGIGSIEPAK